MAELVDRLHFQNLARLSPVEVMKRTGSTWDREEECYLLPLWISTCRIFPGQARIDWEPGAPRLAEIFHLFAIHYLLHAKDIVAAGRWISEKDIPGGATFFRGPHAIPTLGICRRADNSLEAFDRLAHRFAGTPLAMADRAYCFAITDRIPIALLYWLGDEDFPAEAKLLYDASLPRHFALDIIFALAVGVAESLARHHT